MLTLLVALAAHAGPAPSPTQIKVAYTVAFDLPAMADRMCPMTGMCDCTVSYAGRGDLVEHKGDRLTFKGTWAVADGACHDAFTLWVPDSGEAYHTVRLSKDGTQVVEWIAHADPAATERVQSDIKASGQVWLSPLAATLDATGTATHTEEETGQADVLTITSKHTLTIHLTP